jgi:hypothetical protein
VSGTFDSYPHRPAQARGRLLCSSFGVIQATFYQLAHLVIQHGDLLVAGV